MERRGFLGAFAALLAAPKRILGLESNPVSMPPTDWKLVRSATNDDQIVGIAMGPADAQGRITVLLQGNTSVQGKRVVTWHDLHTTA